MKPAAVETWVWVLVFAGLLVFVLGLAVERNDPGLGWWVQAGGGVVAAAGVGLFVLRSRMPP